MIIRLQHVENYTCIAVFKDLKKVESAEKV